MKSHSIITFLLTSTAILGASLLAKAESDKYYQDFKTLESYKPWTGGASHEVGKTPQGWYVSNVAGMSGAWLGATEVATYADGVVTLTNKNTSGQNIPAYMSLGTTWNTAKISWFSTVPSAKDGGSFGGIKIEEQPTAIEITYKSSSDKAQLIAYTWQGTWTSKDVPSNISTSPSKSTMLNRDQVVLNYKERKNYTESKDDNAKLLSSVEANLKATNGFTTVTIPLNNVATATDGAQKFLNIIVSAGPYFSTSVDKDLSISVKEIKLVKDHTSQALKANAESEDTFYHLNEVNLDGATTIGYYSFDTQKATPEKPRQGKYITVYMLADGSIKRVLSE